VAFGGGADATSTNVASLQDSGIDRNALAAASVVPATLHMEHQPRTAASEKASTKKIVKRAAPKVREQQSMVARARVQGQMPWSEVIEVKASGSITPVNAEVSPVPVLFMETTEYIDSNATVWSVQVWRVVWVTPAQQRGPVSKST